MNRCKRTARLWYERSFPEMLTGANRKGIRDRPTPKTPPAALQKKYSSNGFPLQPPKKINYGIAAYILGYVVLFLIIAGTLFGAIAAILAGR